MKYRAILIVDLDSEDQTDAEREANHLAEGLGDSEQTLVSVLDLSVEGEAVLINRIDTKTIQQDIDNRANVPMTVQDVCGRIEGMYAANTYEDIKWAIHDIYETHDEDE